MNKKLLILIAALLILAVLAFGPAGDLLTILALPFTALGAALRWLSLSGGVGNLLALILYALVCLTPVLLWRKTKRAGEDWLLVLMSAVLVLVLYLMVNPALRPGMLQNQVGDVIYAGAVWSVLITWGVMKLLRSSDRVLDANIYGALRLFLLTCAASCLLQGFGLGFAGLRERITALQEGNTMFGVNLWPTYIFFALDFAAGAMEQGMLALIFLRGSELLTELERDPYSDGSVAAGRQVSLWCKRTLIAASAADLALNLGQVFCAGMLHNVDVTVRLPIASMAVAFGMLALTRLLVQGKELKDDNDLFI